MNFFIGKLLNKKFSVFILSLLAIAFGLIYVIPYAFNWDSYKYSFIEKIKQKSGNELTIESGVSYVSMPFPHLVMENIKMTNMSDGKERFMLESKSVEITPSILALLSGDISFGKIHFVDPVFNVESFKDDKNNWLKFLDKAGSSEDIRSVTAENAKIFFATGSRSNPIKRTILLPTANIKKVWIFDVFKISGEISSEENEEKAKYEIKLRNIYEGNKPIDLSFSIYSGGSNFSANGDIKNISSGRLFEGNFSSKFSSDIISFKNLFPVEAIKKVPLLAGLSIGNEVNLNGQISLADEKIILENISLKSGKTEGSAAVQINLNERTDSRISLNIKELDLDNINHGKEKAKNSNKVPALLADLFLDKELVNILFGIDSVIYNKQKLEGISAEIKRFDSKTEISSFYAKALPGGGAASIKGVIASDEFFDGSVNISGQNLWQFLNWLKIDKDGASNLNVPLFSIYAELSISSDEINIKQIKANLDDTDFTGDISVKGDGVLAKTDVSLNINKIDADKYSGGKNEIPNVQWFSGFIQNTTERFGKLTANIYSDSLIYNSQKLNNFSTALEISDGLIKLDKISFYTEGKKAEGKIIFDNNRFTPYTEIELRFGKLDTSFLYDMVGLERNEDVIKQETTGRWSKERLDFEQLSIFSGKLNLKADEFVHKGINIKDFLIAMNVNNGKAEIGALHAGIFDGTLDIKGNAVLDYPTLNISFSIANAELRDFLSDIFDINAIGGKFSASGSIAASGETIDKLISSVQGAGGVSARGILVNGIDTMLISRKLPSIQSSKELRFFTENAFSSGRSEIDSASGNFNVSAGKISFDNITISHVILGNSYLSFAADLPEWKIDMKGMLALRTKWGNVPLNLNGSGDISSPSVQWDKDTLEKFWEANYSATISP